MFKYHDKDAGDTIKFYGYTDLDTALCHALNENKNMLTIFSGWACNALPGREWKTLSQYGDNRSIQDNFVLLWLPVDDKRPLKDSVPVDVFGPGCYVKTVGGLNYARQLDLTDMSTQPLFCFLDKRGKVFGKRIGCTFDKKEVDDFIQSGLAK